MNKTAFWTRNQRQFKRFLQRRRPVRGFTLVELLVTMAIAAVLAMVAVPSMAAMYRSIKLSSATNVFVSGLHLARSEAIKRNGRVVLCKSNNRETCAMEGGWEQGWIVFHDLNNSGSRELSEPIIRREQPLAGSLRMTGNLTVARYVSFAPTGGTRLLSGGFQAGTVTLCLQSAERGEGRQIILNAVGRPRVHKPTLESCA